MRRSLSVLAVLVGAGLSFAPAQAVEKEASRKTVRYLAWKDLSGQVFAEAVEVSESDDLVQSYHLLIETPEQKRVVVSTWFVPSKDLTLERFLDRTSGWEAELESVSGLGDLGELSEWGFRAMREAMDRLREEGVIPVFTLDTPEIRLRAEDDTDEEGRGAIDRLTAELAASGVLTDLPASAREGLSFAARVLEDSPVGGIPQRVVTILAEALRASGDDGDLPYEGAEWLEATGRPEVVRDDGVSPGQRLLLELGSPPASERVEAIREAAAEDDQTGPGG